MVFRAFRYTAAEIQAARRIYSRGKVRRAREAHGLDDPSGPLIPVRHRDIVVSL